MTIEDAFNLAESKYCSIQIDDTDVMFWKGYKAIKQCSDGSVKVFDTNQGGASYDELTPEQYAKIELHGFREAINLIKENKA